MGPDYFFFYTEANAVCIIIFAILLIHNRSGGTRQEKQIWFDRTVIAHILYFTSDIGWAAVLSGQLPRTRFLVILFNFLNLVLLSLISYEWFRYMAVSEKMTVSANRKRHLLSVLPMAAGILAVLAVFLAAPSLLISDENELQLLYYPLMLAAPLFYIMTSFITSLVNARKADAREDKKLYRLIGFYPLSVVLSGIVQLAALAAPLFCFGCTLMMLYFYIQAMQTQISMDTLTGLNNRGQLSRQMRQIRYRENTRSYAVMIDIDRFKQINDTFGHAEGDRALVLAAEALKQTAEQMKSNVFIARYGGDEFTMIIQTAEDDGVIRQAAAQLQELLEKKQAENSLPYRLEISAGWDMLQNAEDTMEACLVRADRKLYEDKRRTGVGR